MDKCTNCHSSKLEYHCLSWFKKIKMHNIEWRADSYQDICTMIICKNCGKTEVTGSEPHCCICKKPIINSYRTNYCSKECWSNK